MFSLFRAQVNDIEALAPVFDLYRQFYSQTSDLTRAKVFLKDRMEGGESVIFFAKDPANPSQVTGFIQLYPSFSSVSMLRLWILNDLFVVESARGKGLGLALMKKAESFARETGARGVTLKTAIDNESAQKLYNEAGWKKDERFFTYNLMFS